MSIANTSQHLQTLLEARLVVYKKQGLYSYYQLADRTVAAFNRSLQSLAEERLSEIKSFREALYRDRDNMEKIGMDELLTRMKRDDVTLIDVRPRDEYEVLHIPGANSIPLGELEKRLAALPPGKEIVAYCRGKYCMLQYLDQSTSISNLCKPIQHRFFRQKLVLRFQLLHFALLVGNIKYDTGEKDRVPVCIYVGNFSAIVIPMV